TQDEGERAGINRLTQELSRGNNTALFDHTIDDLPPAFTPAQATRAVVAEQAFAFSAGRGKKGEPHTADSPVCRCVIILARGDTLFETLWLNLTVYNPATKDPVPSLTDGEDRPVWERDERGRPDRDPPIPTGYLDYLTWQSRALLLQPENETDGDVVVRRVSYAQGRKFERPAGFFDPMAAYRRDTQTGFPAVRLIEDKALWRDSAALFQFAEADQFRGPTVLETLGQLAPDVLPRAHRYRLSAFGLCTDKAKVHFWRHETLPLSLHYLDHPIRRNALKRALGLAEAVASDVLRRAVWAAVSAALTGDQGQAPDRRRVSDAVKGFRVEDLYWSELERPFRLLLTDIGEAALEGLEDTLDNGVRDWYRGTLRPAAWRAYERTVGRLDSARELRAAARGRDVLATRLRALAVRERLLDSRTEAAT
ncbi:MAG TPA: type I-E CRISPR-associated protein Cse1/CasA, partial [Fimbriiglobus sp.]|nr:type I-E CRISPR-associated protein Cse1/CasA [Fimbriiglobus sp.]